MNYKVIIDPYRGGSDNGFTSGSLVEKEFNLDVSKAIYNNLKNKGVDVSLTRNSDRTLTDDERISLISSLYDMGSNVIVISNRLNDGSLGGAEINYALRNNSNLARYIADSLENNSFAVNKYYQQRSEGDTYNDADIIIRETNPNQTLVIYYGYVSNSDDNKKLLNNSNLFAKAVSDAILEYIGVGTSTDYYIVKSGDTLYAIARKFNLSVDELKSANNLSTNTLMIGQKLIIPSEYLTYVVKKGDSLYAIARSFATTVDAIKSLNNLSSNLLSIGQVLKIPNAEGKTYVVKKGDSLYSIARENNTTVDKLKSLNNLSSNLLSIGQILKLPS